MSIHIKGEESLEWIQNVLALVTKEYSIMIMASTCSKPVSLVEYMDGELRANSIIAYRGEWGKISLLV